MEYGFGYSILRSPYTPYSIYLRGTITSYAHALLAATVIWPREPTSGAQLQVPCGLLKHAPRCLHMTTARRSKLGTLHVEDCQTQGTRPITLAVQAKNMIKTSSRRVVELLCRSIEPAFETLVRKMWHRAPRHL